jgi:hypothetical protein
MTSTQPDGLFDAPPTGQTARLQPHTVVVSARVAPALRDAINNARRPGEDASAALRRLVELGLDAQARAAEALDGPGTARKRGTPTEVAAALKVTPRAGSQRARALEAFADAGARGLTADEVVGARTWASLTA